MKKLKQQLAFLSVALLVGGCTSTKLTTGGSDNLVSGSAAGGASVNANKSLHRCDKPLGTMAVSDGRIEGSRTVTTVEPLLRLAIQQSNCFMLTAAGNEASQAKINRIKDKMRNSGETRAGSNIHKGQMVATDYILEPSVIVANESTGGSSASVGAAVGSFNPLAGAIVGGLGAMSAKEIRTSDVALTLTDVRSEVQVALASGSATVENSAMGGNLGMAGWGGLIAGAGGVGMSSYSRTPEGQAIAAAFFDAYNNLVDAVRNYRPQEIEGGAGRGGSLIVK